jgi:hypothetical protein
LGTAPTYQWQINGTGAGTSSAAFVTSTLTNGNTVRCIVTSNAACVSPATATSNSISMVVNAGPTVSINPSGPLKLCAGDSLHLTASGGSSYLWTTTDTSASIWIHQGGTYNVTGNNGTCTASAVTPATVTLNTPTAPTVTQNHNVITSSLATGYQWVLNNSPLAGDTSRTLTITQSGTYAVITTDTNGCHAKSINYIFTYVNGIGTIGADLGVKLYPVPNQGSFMIEAADLSDADMAIYDIYGHKLYQQRLTTDRTQISGLDLSAGVYFITVSDHGRMETIKMQVTKE